MKKVKTILFTIVLLASLSAHAQWTTQQSVLHEGSWYKIGVVEDGVYGIDAAMLQSLGVDLSRVDPSRIRMFGNVAGALPERNADSRYDDLTELAIQVTGADDGSFDGTDRIRFYGQGPVTMSLGITNTYTYERNPYSDTTYYFLCLQNEGEGLRIQEQPSAAVDGEAVITDFPDFWYHESEELSPYASGRTWYGDAITTTDGFKEFRYDMPDYVKSKPVRLYSKILGRCPSAFTYSMWLNGVNMVNGDTIKGYQEHVFGREKTVDRILTLGEDGFSVRYSILPIDKQPLLYIDYFVINYWRELVFHQHELAFRIIPSQFILDRAEVHLSGVNAGLSCWEVTNPLRPSIQQMSVSSGNGLFAVEGAAERRFHLFGESGVKSVASAYPIPNQNLHALTTADYLIITHEAFREQAEALAAFHREEDGMECLVVDVREILNEFGTGMLDPTAIRDFIRMIYLRSGTRLRYVLLFGKGTHDYRNIKGVENNFVPIYETLDYPYSQTDSKCSDDYYALMDPSEGYNCQGKVDLGVGRLPVTTPEQADDVVRKIKHYADRSVTHGPWLNNHLFLIDNDQQSYFDNVEYLDRILDTACRTATAHKLYVDSYPIVTTPSGKRIPEAHDALMDCFEKGVGVMSYTGHGGVTNLMEEHVLTISDIQAMRNYDRLPFVHTATCEFSECDNPLRVSAGEYMILNPEGGAIALLTTTRPTYAPHNQNLSKSLHVHLYDFEDGERLRFGDIVRISKADPSYYHEKNISYVLLGDPALRFAYPSMRVSTLRINELSPQTVVAPASSMVTLEGCVSSAHDRIDTLFNGVVDVRVYDKKSTFTTLGAIIPSRSYSYYHDVLFEGKAEVVRGQFSVSFVVPIEVNFGQGNARVSYYAYDSIRGRSATGVFDMLNVTGADPSVAPDHQGPEIAFYWNTPDFTSGEVVTRKGTLYADLFDEQGIYHYNVSIGRDIIMRSDVKEYDNLILNDWFEPALNDFRHGRIVIPVDELESGTHEFSLKAWDTQGNASEKTIVLVIEDGIMLAQVYTAPNPFTEGTYFCFRHGEMTEALQVRVEVYDVMGRHVAGFATSTNSYIGEVPPIYWNGCGSGGHRLSPGLYVYRLQIEDEKGNCRTVSGRMVMR